MRVPWILLVLILLPPNLCDAKLLSDIQRKSVVSFEESSLLLLPQIRRERSINDRGRVNSSTKKKYHRLAHSVHVQSDIRYRYATTLVTSHVRNSEHESREIFLTVILPDTAFISRFAIEVGGQLFVAYVKEKTEAWREYQEAVSQGKTAGHVGISARHSNHFRVSVNTAAKSSVTFYLLYEELLQRRAGIYEHVINLTPRQKLKQFEIDVNIFESKELTHLHVPELRRHEINSRVTNELQGVVIQRSGEKAVIKYKPNLEELQKKLKTRHALQFVVEYDVARPEEAGEIQVVDGYFVHFVAPEKFPPIPKHVVFVLDTSGSMRGKKMKQTKNAMRTILGELKKGSDYFTIITFADDAATWTQEGKMVIKSSETGLRDALEYVESLEPQGGTNINDALIQALTIATHVEKRLDVLSGVQPILFFLTDGHPTSGETRNEVILENVKRANFGSLAPVFSLAFGRQADFNTLKVLSLQNNAFARKIYVAADASLQLEGFYQEVSSPLLRNVRFKYEEDEVIQDSLTSTNFHTFYQGSEMIVAGKLPNVNHHNIIEYQILATRDQGNELSLKGNYTGSEPHLYPQIITETIFDVKSSVRASHVNFLERLWAYLTIQNRLERVAKGELNSCPEEEEEEKDLNGQTEIARARRSQAYDHFSDDEDYDDGSGYEDMGAKDNEKESVDDIMEEIGDADIIICDNLELALYLSLKYEFVTPLTSLVVVKPDSGKEDGQFGELENLRFMASSSVIHHSVLAVLCSVPIFLFTNYVNQNQNY